MHAYILIDRSASMGVRWDEVKSSFNEYLAGLFANDSTRKARVTASSFSTYTGASGLNNLAMPRSDSIEYDTFIDNAPIKLCYKYKIDFEPTAMTPLYDAIGMMCAKIKEDDPEKASVLIVTDGHENASSEWNRLSSEKELNKLRKKGYDVVFLGADFDNESQAKDLGNDYGQTISMTAGNYSATMSMMAGRVSSYASTGHVAEFSNAERKLAKGRAPEIKVGDVKISVDNDEWSD